MGMRKLGAVLWTLAVLGVLASAAGPAAAQGADGAAEDRSLAVAERPLASRAELEAELEALERRMESASGERAVAAERSAERIRERLRTGDFRVRDVVEVRVPSDSTLTGSFPVNRDRHLEWPTLPPVDLRGVLYSEIETVLREELGQYIRHPQVRARALWRVAVVGGVASPGYYDISPSSTLSDALMRAGGPTQRAKLDDVEFRRGGRDLLEEVDQPVESLTLADLGAQRGDQLYVPERGRGGNAMGVLGVVSGLAGTAWAITRIF